MPDVSSCTEFQIRVWNWESQFSAGGRKRRISLPYDGFCVTVDSLSAAEHAGGDACSALSAAGGEGTRFCICSAV